MKNLFFSLLMIFFVSVAYNVQAQEAILDGEVVAVAQDNAQQDQPQAEQTVFQKIKTALGLDIWGLLAFAMTIISAVAGTYWAMAKRKLRQAGEILITIANYIEDKNLDANERQDLARRAKELFSKN